MTFEKNTLETNGSVAVLTLNSPNKLNAMNQSMLREMLAACDRVESKDAVRALVLTGSGKALSTGFDLAAQAKSPPQGRAEWEPVLRTDFDAVM